MHESITRQRRSVEIAEAAVLRNKRVTKLHQLAARVLRTIGERVAVVQMDLNLTPARVAVLGQAFQ